MKTSFPRSYFVRGEKVRVVPRKVDEVKGSNILELCDTEVHLCIDGNNGLRGGKK